MNESYKIICVNRHILINNHQNGLVVIDTGSPVSFHKHVQKGFGKQSQIAQRGTGRPLPESVRMSFY